MADDLSSNSSFRDLADRVRRLENTQMLQNASVTEGRLRFIGGLLLIDSGGTLRIVGTLEVNGTTTITGTTSITGPTTVTGEFTVSGPWSITGDGEITGDYTVTGKVTQVGDFDLEGDFNVKSGGKVTIEGDSPIVMQTVGGEARLSVGGALLRAFGALGVVLELGNYRVKVDSVEAAISGPNSEVAAQNGLIAMDGSIRFDPNDIPYASGTGLALGALLIDGMGNLFRSDGS